MIKLDELAPRWLFAGDAKVGMIFRCPHCVAAAGYAGNQPTGGRPPAGLPKPTPLACFFVPTEILGDEHYIENQQRLFERALAGDAAYAGTAAADIVPSRAGFAWRRTGEDFAGLTVTPSIDASAAGHWHGFITNGEAI